MRKANISDIDLMDLVYWARRYCDGRSTYDPSSFNSVYRFIRSMNPDLVRSHDRFDETLTEKGAYWPFAQDGMHNKETGSFDATKIYGVDL